MKRLRLLVLSLISCYSLQAQEVVSTQGDYYSNSTSSVSFTIGEVVIDTGTNGSTDLTQGFQQTNWNLVGLDDLQPDYAASIFPNPTSESLTISVDLFEHVKYELFDNQGRLIRKASLQGTQTKIEVAELAPGAYSVRLNDAGNQTLKLFKLIKN